MEMKAILKFGNKHLELPNLEEMIFVVGRKDTIKTPVDKHFINELREMTRKRKKF